MLPLPMQDSLPAGWLAFTGWELNPLGRNERFPRCYIFFPFPGFILTLREFIGLAGGAAIAWATHGRAQQDVRVRRIGFLSGVADTDPEIQSWAKAFVQGLEELGWVKGRNVRIDTRFGDADA